ncbi:hypothetical protein [Streptosporangium sp. NPDC004631]
MAFGQTATPPHTEVQEDEGVTELTAEQHDRALAVVQRLLKARGVRARCHHRIGLKLFGDGRPFLLGERRQYLPELVVYSGAGRKSAVISMDRQSSHYLISHPTFGVERRTVNADQPQAVVEVILATLSRMGDAG